jgi:hypothetical protein
MEHPHGAMMTVFADGRVAVNKRAALPYDGPEAEYLPAARRLADQWVGDMRFALNYLTQLNEGDPQNRFTGSLDMGRIGVFGHSTGGGAVLQLAGTDDRVKAGLTEDIYLTPVCDEVLDRGVPQPFAFLFSQVWAEDRESGNNRTLRDFAARLHSPHYTMHILGTTHYDFTDLPALSPLAHALGLKGPIRGRRVHQIVNDYSLAFFNQYLKGEASPLLAGPSQDFPEVVFDEAHRGDLLTSAAWAASGEFSVGADDRHPESARASSRLKEGHVDHDPKNHAADHRQGQKDDVQYVGQENGRGRADP